MREKGSEGTGGKGEKTEQICREKPDFILHLGRQLFVGFTLQERMQNQP